MATFLELAQKVAHLSGTVPNAGPPGSSTALPASVTTNDVTQQRVLSWVRDAWVDVQTREPGWRWMRSDFERPLLVGKGSYAPGDFSLDRWQRWLPFDERGMPNFSLYLAKADEAWLDNLPWSEFRHAYGIGTHETGRPGRYAIANDGALHLYQAPDAVYTLRGWYRRTAQVLTAAGDVPEMPAQFHDLIVYAALLKLDVFDEASTRVDFWEGERNRIMGSLRLDQLPQLILGGPLA